MKVRTMINIAIFCLIVMEVYFGVSRDLLSMKITMGAIYQLCIVNFLLLGLKERDDRFLKNKIRPLITLKIVMSKKTEKLYKELHEHRIHLRCMGMLPDKENENIKKRIENWGKKNNLPIVSDYLKTLAIFNEKSKKTPAPILAK